MEKTITLRTNYDFYKADTRTIALVLLELWVAKTMAALMDWNTIRKCYQDKIPAALKKYKWSLQKHIKKWSGHNLVPLSIRSTIASRITGATVTPTLEANYMALWTDNTAATNADTQLVAEHVRGTFSDRFAVDNVAYLDKFFTSDEVGGETFLEAWIFTDGTATANSGNLLSRILIDETIADTETLTINATFTIW